MTTHILPPLVSLSPWLSRAFQGSAAALNSMFCSAACSNFALSCSSCRESQKSPGNFSQRGEVTLQLNIPRLISPSTLCLVLFPTSHQCAHPQPHLFARQVPRETHPCVPGSVLSPGDKNLIHSGCPLIDGSLLSETGIEKKFNVIAVTVAIRAGRKY